MSTTDLESARERTAVARHPLSAQITALLARGKSAWWIATWLEERYPLVVTTEEGVDEDHPDAALHRRLRIGEDTLERYRTEFMPEFAPGVDVVFSDIEDIIGRRFPGSTRGPAFELELLETATNVAQHNLAMALQADSDLEMLQETTLQANDSLVATVQALIDAKQKLGVEGYEPLPEHHIIDQTTKSLSVELHGRLDPKTGAIGPTNPERVELVKQLMAAPADQRTAVLEAAKRLPASAPVVGEDVDD